MEQKTLLKLLIACGLGSRRHLANTIRQGKIRINGEIAENFSYPVDLKKDIILIDGKPVKPKPISRIVLLLNKPAGVLSTTKDDYGRKTVIDILPQKYQNTMLYPVGRLDKDTTGLLLLTNDGDLTYQLTHPKFEHEKEYLIFTKTELSSDEILLIEKGVQLEDGITYPSKIKECRTYQPYNYSIIIHEGRNRQIRRMFAKLGIKVIALKRIRVSGLKLGILKEGEVRELSTPEINQLLHNSK